MPENSTQYNERRAGLTLAAVGIVFGDIGTSPLYALRYCFSDAFGLAPTEANVMGILSLIAWALILIVSLKYLLYLMRAENHGEGGMLALMALAQPHHSLVELGSKKVIIYAGILGAGLLFGDGIITPALSVLSAVEGLSLASPTYEPYILPLTALILISLFISQKRGPARLSSFFGPIVLLWFVAIGLLGAAMLIEHPAVLAAFSPTHALSFFLNSPTEAFLALGAVFLVITGGEALYSEMGKFGARPIRLAWIGIVLPSLLLNYFGQGALILSNPAAVEAPFFSLCPPALLLPLVLLAILAATIASQALISGAFAITSQAIKLGLLPRMQIVHTSRDQIAQIYVSRINWALLIGTLWVLFEFKNSTALAAVYGLSVSLAMVLTTFIAYFVSRTVWGWSRVTSILVTGFFLTVEFAFFSASLAKIPHGAWVSLAVAAAVFVAMTTWRRGRQILGARLREKLPPFDVFFDEIPEVAPLKVPGTAVYMSAQSEFTPPGLLYNLRHNKVVHELIIIVMVITEEAPYVSPVRRVEVESLGREIYRVRIHYGFMEAPDIPRALNLCKAQGLEIDLSEATYFFGRESLLATPRPGMAIWRENLFAFMSQNAQKAPRFFKIKADQVIEIGFEVEL